MIKAIIFDFDGTIADSFETVVKIFSVISPRKIELNLSDIEKLRGLSLGQILKELGIKKWQIPSLLRKGRKKLTEEIVNISSFNKLDEAVATLSDQGYDLFIISTNSETNIHKFLKVNNMDQYFKHVKGDIGLTGKSRAIRFMQKQERRTLDECVYVGDETRDIEAAKKAGVKCVAVTWGFNHKKILEKYKPDQIVNSAIELPSIIKSMNNKYV